MTMPQQMHSNIISIRFCLIFSILIIVGIMASCNSGELTRSTAQELIEESNEFKSIMTLNVVPSNEETKKRYGSKIYKISKDETPEEAKKRALEGYFDFNTDIGLANHLKFLDIKQDYKGEEPRKIMGPKYGAFIIETNTRTSKKGKALWDEVEIPEGVNVDKETQLPLAKKEIIEITGINKQNENNATVEFTYKWNPFLLGKYMDANTEEHKNLSEEVRKSLGPSNKINRGNKLKDWSSSRKGIAIFQKYDDGWRLQMVRF